MHTETRPTGNGDESGRRPGAAGRAAEEGAAHGRAAEEGVADGRVANLLGALALEAADVQEAAARPVVGQGGAAAAALVTIAAHPGRSIEQLRAPLGLSQPGAVRLVD